MALVVPDTFLCRLKWTQPTNMRHAPQNVFGIQVDPAHGNLEQTECDAIANKFDLAWTAGGLASSFVSSCDPLSIQVTDIRTATGPQFETALTSQATGTADPLPGEVALVTSLRTALRGRSFRGRWYWPGLVESVNDSAGRPSSTVTAGCTTILSTFNTGLDALANIVGLCVISRLLASSQKVTSFSTSNSWDSQRRRGFV